jgi:HlyD family secretion protein
MNEILAAIMAALAFVFPGLAQGPGDGFSGYLEADYVYAAATTAGTVAAVEVEEGQAVAVGDVLFTLSSGQQQALVDAARARVAAAQATLANLMTGSRNEEIEVIRASLEKAQSDLALARSTLERSERLFASGTIPRVRLDQDRAAATAAEAQVMQLQAEMQVAELPARSAQQVAAEAELAAARAEAARAELDLADRQVRASVAGIVDRVYFKPGEMAQAGTPVVSVLPEGSLKARFFVDQNMRAGLARGEAVEIACDGCPAGITGTITYLSAEPQTTPPIIYSREERARMVFMAEAVVAEPGNLLPGQPVNVRPAP